MPSATDYRYNSNQGSNPPKYFVETCEQCDPDDPDYAYHTVNASADFFCWDPDYNKWAYGLDNITSDDYHQYFEQDWDKRFQVKQYAFRDVWYLSGVEDQCSPAMTWYNTSQQTTDLVNLGAYNQACDYHHVDTRCAAMLQGPWREYRATHYVAYLTKFYGQNTHWLVSWITNQNFNLVPGVGHDGTGMLTSSEGIQAIYVRTSQTAVMRDQLGW